MSKSDVQILRSFARKLAAVDAESELKLIPADGKEVTPVAPTSQSARIEQSRHKGLAAQNTLQSKLLRGLGSVGAGAKSIGQGAQKYLANADLGSMAGGMAGGIGAGLGARGLANLFRSKEDEEKDHTPWWADAAGVGAGVGGAVLGANYLPQLLSMLTAQKAPGNSGTAAPAAAPAPAAK